MARARLLKPGFFTNDSLAELPAFGRLLFAGLWCLADREGRLPDRPKRIKAELLPFDRVDVESLLTKLALGGFISRYTAHDGHQFIQVLAFGKHQSPHIKEPASTIPAPGQNGSRPAVAEALTLNPIPKAEAEADRSSLSIVIALHEQHIGLLSERRCRDVTDWANRLPKDEADAEASVRYAFDEAEREQTRVTWNYVEAILSRLESEGWPVDGPEEATTA